VRDAELGPELAIGAREKLVENVKVPLIRALRDNSRLEAPENNVSDILKEKTLRRWMRDLFEEI